jgi:hypothetical protein
MQARKYTSEKLQKLQDEINSFSWYKKLSSDIKLQIWVWKCLSRKYWDKSFEHYIFRKNE